MFLTLKKREKLYDELMSSSIFAVVHVSPKKIDKINILQAYCFIPCCCIRGRIGSSDFDTVTCSGNFNSKGRLCGVTSVICRYQQLLSFFGKILCFTSRIQRSRWKSGF